MLCVVSRRVPLVLVLVMLVGGTGFAFGAYASARDQRSGTPGLAKVSSCGGHDGRYDTGVRCTGSWVAGGTLLDGGHVVVGDIANADRGDVGKTIHVRIHGDGHATKPKMRVSIVLAAIAVLMLGLGTYLLLLRSRRPPSPGPNAPPSATEEHNDAMPDVPFDIPACDADLARFYGVVFGWSVTKDGVLTTADGIVVARPRPDLPTASDSAIGNVYVGDTYRTLAQARNAGGSTRGVPALTSDALFMFGIFYDPKGNPVAVITPSSHREALTDVDVPALLAAGRWTEAVDVVDRLWPSGPGEDPCGDNIECKAAWWEARGDELEVAEPYERASGLFSAHAAGATSGGEGYARMQDVQRVAAKVAALRAPRAQ
jgi:predicted enzyme related to lactoylglutathione lyase